MFQFHAQVVDESTHHRGFLELTTESGQWLKQIRTVFTKSEANVHCFLAAKFVCKPPPLRITHIAIWICTLTHRSLCTQICYEVTQDIPAGCELCSMPREPLHLHGSQSQDERSDRETGEIL